MKSAIIRTGFDTLYFSGAHVLMRPFFEGVGAVVMLHHVRPQRPGDFQPNRLLEVSPQFLEQTLAWLRRRNIDEFHPFRTATFTYLDRFHWIPLWRARRR